MTFQSERSIPRPTQAILPPVTVPIYALNYCEAGLKADDLQKNYFNNHFNCSTLSWIEDGLFVVTFGYQGETDTRWDNEKYADDMKFRKKHLQKEAEATSCTTS